MDGDIIPLRWDRRTYFLDSFVRKNATDGKQSDEIRFADTVFSSPVHQPRESVYNLVTMHKDKPNTESTPLHFRVVDLAGMSHTGIEHCRCYGHMAYDRLNATRLALRLPPLRVPPKGLKCAICCLNNARVKAIPGHSKKVHDYYGESTHNSARCKTCRVYEERHAEVEANLAHI